MFSAAPIIFLMFWNGACRMLAELQHGSPSDLMACLLALQGIVPDIWLGVAVANRCRTSDRHRRRRPAWHGHGIFQGDARGALSATGRFQRHPESHRGAHRGADVRRPARFEHRSDRLHEPRPFRGRRSIGLSTLEPEYRDILRSLGASQLTIFWKIALPKTLPERTMPAKRPAPATMPVPKSVVAACSRVAA